MSLFVAIPCTDAETLLLGANRLEREAHHTAPVHAIGINIYKNPVRTSQKSPLFNARTARDTQIHCVAQFLNVKAGRYEECGHDLDASTPYGTP
jgi:hypothetical protein